MSQELDSYLEGLTQNTLHYRKVSTLHQSAEATTELVMLEGASATSIGPYIRKIMSYSEQNYQLFCRLRDAMADSSSYELHVCRVLEVTQSGDALEVIFEYVEGMSLSTLEIDKAQRGCSWIVRDVLLGLNFLHSLEPPVVHRDIKPENIVVDLTQQRACIIDLGIARNVKPQTEHDTVRFGTKSWCPPEQFGFGQTTAQSDIYSAGLLAYWIQTHTIPDQNDRAQHFPLENQELSHLVQKAAELDPARRFESAAQMLGAWSDIFPEQVQKDEQATMPAALPEQKAADKYVARANGKRTPILWHLYNGCIIAFLLLWVLIGINSLFVPENSSNIFNIAIIVFYAIPMPFPVAYGLMYRAAFERIYPRIIVQDVKQKWISVLLVEVVLFTIMLLVSIAYSLTVGR